MVADASFNQNKSGEDEANMAQDEVLLSTISSGTSGGQQLQYTPNLLESLNRLTGHNAPNPIAAPSSQPLGQLNPTLISTESRTITAPAGAMGRAPSVAPTRTAAEATFVPEEATTTTSVPILEDDRDNLFDDPYLYISAQYFAKSRLRMAAALGKEAPDNYRAECVKSIPEIAVAPYLSGLYGNRSDARDLQGIALDFTKLWLRKKRPINIPWEQALQNYKDCSESELTNWQDSDTLYPLPIAAFTHTSPTEAKEEFRTNAITVIGKWRSPADTLPRIYPLEKDWKDGDCLQFLYDKQPFILTALEALTFNRVQGIDENGQLLTKYFIIQHHEGNCRAQLLELQKEIGSPPFFLLPKFGVNQRLHNHSMTELEAKQAVALFRVEMEACLLEIWSYINPTMSAETFKKNKHTIWKIHMPFWKKEVL
jgi:hypothetical protein